MQRTNFYDEKFKDLKYIQVNKSVFMSESDPSRKNEEFDSKSVKIAASPSTQHQLNPYQNQEFSSRKLQKHSTQKPFMNRPLSLSVKQREEVRGKMRGDSKDKSVYDDFNSHLVKLKVEQMVFKFKSRVGSLLKEINITVAQLGKFASLAKIDDILNFLSEKIKQKLINTELKENNVTKIRSKQRQLLSEYQSQIQSLKKRIQQKQNIEKTNKIKIKQNHNEIRQLYDKINMKEKELSNKTTELYQTKTLLKQHEKLIQGFQLKSTALENERNDLREQLENSNKNIHNNYLTIEQFNKSLKSQIQELRESLLMASEKQLRLIQFNRNMSEEVARWRERFQQQREKIIDQASQNVQITQEKYSTETEKEYRTGQLLISVNRLENEVGNLKKQIISLRAYKEKYETAMKHLGSNQHTQNIGEEKEKLFTISNTQMESYYKNKMQQISKQWKDKLIQMVDNYSQEEQKVKEQLLGLKQKNKILQSKIFTLASQKYFSDCKVIEKQSQIYQLAKKMKEMKSKDPPSEEMLISDSEINLNKESSSSMQVKTSDIKESNQINKKIQK